MDLSFVLVLGLVPFLAMLPGVGHFRVRWVLVVLAFPLLWLVLVAVVHPHGAGWGAFWPPWVLTVALSAWGRNRWTRGARWPVSRGVALAVLSCAAVCGWAAIGAVTHGSPAWLNTAGYAPIGLYTAALALLAASDRHSWLVAVSAAVVAVVGVVPWSASNVGELVPAFAVADLTFATVIVMGLLTGWHLWRRETAGAQRVDGGAVAHSVTGPGRDLPRGSSR